MQILRPLISFMRADLQTKSDIREKLKVTNIAEGIQT
jgi:hypothetical protein